MSERYKCRNYERHTGKCINSDTACEGEYSQFNYKIEYILEQEIDKLKQEVEELQTRLREVAIKCGKNMEDNYQLKQQLAEKDKVVWLLGETYTTFTNHCEDVGNKKIGGRFDVEKYVDYMCRKCGGDSICDVRDCKNREEYRKQANQIQEADCIILEEVK